MSTNFVQLNPTAANQLGDAGYDSDSLVTGGITTDAILPSNYLNKANYQWSTFITAFAQALVAKSYSPNDGSANPATAVANLVGVFSNIMTQADMTPFARLASPTLTGTPQAPTPAPGTNSTQIATAAFVTAALTSGFSANLNFPNGYIKLPAILGGLVIQWLQGGQQTGNGEFLYPLNFPLPFPNACLGACVTTIINGSNIDADLMYQQIGIPTKTQIQIQSQYMGGGTVSPFVTFTAGIVAVGY